MSADAPEKSVGPAIARRLNMRCAPRPRTTYLHSLAGPKQFMGALDRKY